MTMNLDQLLEDEKLHNFEGSSGVRNLAILAGKLGYKDRQYMGQFRGGCIGDLIEMLEDNSGMCQAIVDFIRENESNYELEEEENDD
jgi:hypothetical protein